MCGGSTLESQYWPSRGRSLSLCLTASPHGGGYYLLKANLADLGVQRGSCAIECLMQKYYNDGRTLAVLVEPAFALDALMESPPYDTTFRFCVGRSKKDVFSI